MLTLENSTRSHSVRHSFSVCACLGELLASVMITPSSPSSLVSTSSLFLLPFLPSAQGFCVCFGCGCRATLLTGQTHFVCSSEVLSLCQSAWPDPHTHSSTCPNTHLKRAQTDDLFRLVEVKIRLHLIELPYVIVGPIINRVYHITIPSQYLCEV